MDKISLTGEPFNDKNALVLNGVAYDVGTRVIRWDDAKGFDGYTTKTAKYTDDKTGKTKTIKGVRYNKGRKLDQINQLFIHHSGGDRADPSVMYNVLWNQRALSVQFCVEDDGRIYQFLDGVDQAKHGGNHNPISIGFECCLFPFVKDSPHYYKTPPADGEPWLKDERGNLPHETMVDTIHDQKIKVFCFTEPQTMALAKACAGLWVGLRHHGAPVAGWPRFPRNEQGKIPRTVFSEHLKHKGLIGHLQCTKKKPDPAGFPWDDFEKMVTQEVRQMEQFI